MKTRNFYQRRDLCLIIIVLLVSGAVWWLTSQNRLISDDLVARVQSSGDIVLEIPLNSAHFGTYQVPDKQVELEVSEKGIRFLHSNCPDQICVNAGNLNTNGNFAACIPNDVLVKVEKRLGDANKPNSTAPDVVIGK